MQKTDDLSRFNYQLLGRLKQDCDYYLGNGNRAKKHLWAGDEAEQIKKMKELYDALPEKPQWITLEDIARYEQQLVGDAPAQVVPSIKVVTSDDIDDVLSRRWGTGASGYYGANVNKCSALMGRFLFEDVNLVEDDFKSKEALYLCTGNSQWTPVEGGMEAVIREVRREIELNDQAGILNRDLPEDWGVIANDAGQILARASCNGGVRKQRFLGVAGGPLESAPVTVQRVGIAWEPRDSTQPDIQRHRG
jgi:hypothetical protein